MAGFRRLEDIEAWREAWKYAAHIYRVTSAGPWAKDFGLRDQIRRASVSISCNIAEGYARETDPEFVRFLAIARGSATEVKTQLYIACELNYITKEEFRENYAKVDQICRMITGLMQFLKNKSVKKGMSGKQAADDRPPITDDFTE